MNTDQGDDVIIAALSRIIVDLVLDGRLRSGAHTRTAAEAMIAELDQRGLRIVGARTGTLAGNRTTDVTLTQYQQILGDRNRLQAQLDAIKPAQACGCRLSGECRYHTAVNPRGDRD